LFSFNCRMRAPRDIPLASTISEADPFAGRSLL
jgi:hypothetical protein